MSTLVVTGDCVVLPDHDTPKPATLVIDLASGKIKGVQLGKVHTEYDDDTLRIDAGDKIVLPGLVE
jgi:allantoinase